MSGLHGWTGTFPVYVGYQPGNSGSFPQPFIYAPTIISVTPDSSARNKTLAVVIVGTHLLGTTIVDFGAGITVNSFVVTSETQIDANITVVAGTTLGFRDVSATNFAGTATLVNGFEVIAVTNFIAEILINDEVVWSAANDLPQQELSIDVTHYTGPCVLKFRIRGIV